MSWEERWVLPHAIDTYEATDIAKKVGAMMPDGTEVTSVVDEDGDIIVRVSFSESELDSVGAKLAGDGFLDWEWESEIDPPRHTEHYVVQIELKTDEQPLISVYSNDTENRAAWPLAFTIAARLAEELDAIEEDA